jgi:hypothetical protein
MALNPSPAASLMNVRLLASVTLYDLTGNDHVIDGTEWDVYSHPVKGGVEVTLDVSDEDESEEVQWLRANQPQLLATFDSLGALVRVLEGAFEHCYDITTFNNV